MIESKFLFCHETRMQHPAGQSTSSSRSDVGRGGWLLVAAKFPFSDRKNRKGRNASEGDRDGGGSSVGSAALEARHGHSAVVFNDAMFVYAGFGNESRFLDDLHCFLFGKNEWVRLKPKRAPAGRHSHSAVVYKNAMFVFGGIVEGKPVNDLLKFNFALNSWDKVNAKGYPPPGVWGHTAVVHKEFMWVFGGMAASGYTNTLHRYSFGHNQWENVTYATGNAPSARQLHSAVVHEDRMWIFGGYSGSNHNDLFSFDFKELSWTKIDVDCPVTPRRGHRAVILNGAMAIHGGRDKQGSFADVHLFDSETLQWSTIDQDNNKNKNDEDEKDKDENNDSSKNKKEKEKEKEKKKKKKEDGDDFGVRPSARYFHSAVVWSGNVWVFAGIGKASEEDPKAKNLNDLYQFAPSGVFFLGSPSDEIEDDDEQSKNSKKKSDSKTNKQNNNKIDFLTQSPAEVALLILEFLDTRSLATSSSTCRAWQRLIDNDHVWKRPYLDAWLRRSASSDSSNPFHQGFTTSPSSSSSSSTSSQKPATSDYKHKLKLLVTKPDEVKCVILGGGGVGKSALCHQFYFNHFLEEYDPTIEDSFRNKFMVDGMSTIIDCLDTAGPEEYSAMRDQYVRTGSVFMVVYSVTSNGNSFDEVSNFVDLVRRAKEIESGKVPVIIVGNKIDLAGDRRISTEDGKLLAERLGVQFIETSAKTRENRSAFHEMVRIHRRVVGFTVSEPAQKKKCVIS